MKKKSDKRNFYWTIKIKETLPLILFLIFFERKREV